jgi:aspartyl-tRNA(Asn)/glutamyl-tRNA(Gln) amidotransferase subunit A
MPLQLSAFTRFTVRPAGDPNCSTPTSALRSSVAWHSPSRGRGALEASHASRSVAAFFGEHDILLTPTAPCVAWSATELGPATIGGVAVAPRAHAVFTPLFNHALTPALSLPCGLGRDRLPVGLQIIARRGRDRCVLDLAAAAERVLSGRP